MNPSKNAPSASADLPSENARYSVQQLDALDPVPCPCGTARRGFIDATGAPASVHIVDIDRDSRTHYHRCTTETYVVLEGHGTIELDGAIHPLRPLTAVMIRPGCRHRARPAPGGGPLRILNIAIPVFDPADEWEDE